MDVIQIKNKLDLLPAGAALFVPLHEVEKEIYFVEGIELSPMATAYIRSKGSN